MHPLDARDLSTAEQRYLSAYVPPCILSQLDADSVRFLRYWLPDDAAEHLGEAGPLLQVLDRYTLEFVRVCVEGDRGKGQLGGAARSQLRRQSAKDKDKEGGVIPKGESAPDFLHHILTVKLSMHPDLYDEVLHGDAPCIVAVIDCQRRLSPSDARPPASVEPHQVAAFRGAWADHEYFSPPPLRLLRLDPLDWRTPEGLITLGGPAHDSSGVATMAARISWLGHSVPRADFQALSFASLAAAVLWIYVVEGLKRRVMSMLRLLTVSSRGS